MIWVYALCDRPEMPLPAGTGLARAPLYAVGEGDVLAVFSHHAEPPGEPAPDALWAHEQVVERLMAGRAVLPMRFASKLPDEDALRSFLASNQSSLLKGLDRVRNRVELAVRVVRTTPDPDAGAVPDRETRTSGREYLLDKLQEQRRADRAVSGVHEPLAAAAVDSRRHAGRAPREILRASYLVDHETVPRFLATIDQLQRDERSVAILSTGPWPPYSFSDCLDHDRPHTAPELTL